MHFSSSINRPPYEAFDGFLQVTSGCSHAHCDFCTFYKDSPFKISPIEEIVADIQELKDYGWRYKRIYLQGADPFILPYDKLMKIADLIHKYLPYVETIGGYARVDNVRNKTVEQLKNLKDTGYENFYFGIETGDDYLLQRMHKGYKSADIVKYMSKLDLAGMPYVANFLGGLGGHGYGLSHARESAKVLNQLHPSMIYASELTLFPDTPLSIDVGKNLYVEATEAERFEEMIEFLRCLTINTVFKAEHVTIIEPVRGLLPNDKQIMIQQLENLLKRAKKGELAGFRRSIRSL